MSTLARNMEVMKKFQDEIRDRLGNGKERITEEDIGRVPYLDLVIKETFRLHPAVPLLLPRETMAHIKVQGYDIPPKRRILVNAWAIARDPKLWTNPEEFNPERFVDSHVDYKGQDFELLPFGSGRRMCPGMAMGMATVELGLLNLLYFFDWKLPDGMTERDIDIEEAGTLTVVKKVPLKLVPVLSPLITPNSSSRK
ncbi:cytochrome P450 71B17-like [Raphanus sativus]|uniref:Cytochrome P450 71B17-like n=1 Tax=Raphanus sativus TaxID=3726 RepID=A0A6J0L2T8_RAPSA|nr:cytochrome P450 71B17-like [Raphanus sativus]